MDYTKVTTKSYFVNMIRQISNDGLADRFMIQEIDPDQASGIDIGFDMQGHILLSPDTAVVVAEARIYRNLLYRQNTGFS